MSDRDELPHILARDDLAGIILDAHATGDWDEASAAADEILARYRPSRKGSAWSNLDAWEKAVRMGATRDELAQFLREGTDGDLDQGESEGVADLILARWRLVPND